MTDLVYIVVAIIAIIFIMKITAKLIKFVLTLAIIGVLIYVLMNSGFLQNIF